MKQKVACPLCGKKIDVAEGFMLTGCANDGQWHEYNYGINKKKVKKIKA